MNIKKIFISLGSLIFISIVITIIFLYFYFYTDRALSFKNDYDNKTTKSLVQVNKTGDHNKVIKNKNNIDISTGEKQKEDNKSIEDKLHITNKAIKQIQKGATYIGKKMKKNNTKENNEKNKYKKYTNLLSKFGQQPTIKNNKVYSILYGKGGQNDDLTDTIKLFVYDIQTNKLLSISIPRDIVIDHSELGKIKINYIYERFINSYGLSREQAIKNTTSIIAKKFDVPISYYGLIDFNFFKKLINRIGGVDICIDKKMYRGGKLLFKPGCYNLDGESALKFSRIRKQDTDFDRQLRQMKVVSSILEKSFKFDLKQLKDIYSLVNKYTATNVNVSQIAWFLGNYKNFNGIEAVVLNNACKSNKGIIYKKFCLLKYVKNNSWGYTLRIKSIDTIRYYIDQFFNNHSIYGCKIKFKGNYSDKFNLENFGVKIKKFRHSSKKTNINVLSGCDKKNVKQFIK